MLNGHINSIDPLFPPMFRHCGYPYETVKHHLLYCEELIELRESLLLPNPTLENCLLYLVIPIIWRKQYNTIWLHNTGLWLQNCIAHRLGQTFFAMNAPDAYLRVRVCALILDLAIWTVDALNLSLSDNHTLWYLDCTW